MMIPTNIRIKFIMWLAYEVVGIPIDVRFHDIPEYMKLNAVREEPVGTGV